VYSQLLPYAECCRLYFDSETKVICGSSGMYMCMCVCVCICTVCACVNSDDDMQSLASLMSLQQNEDYSDSCGVADDAYLSDVANLADVADDVEEPTSQPVLADIQQLVSRSPHKLVFLIILKAHSSVVISAPWLMQMLTIIPGKG